MKKYSPLLLYLGYLAIFAAALIYPSGIMVCGFPAAVLSIGLGSILLIAFRILNPLEGDDAARIKRLEFQVVISSIFYLVATYFMYNKERNWVVCLLVAALIDIIVAFRTPNKK